MGIYGMHDGQLQLSPAVAGFPQVGEINEDASATADAAYITI